MTRERLQTIAELARHLGRLDFTIDRENGRLRATLDPEARVAYKERVRALEVEREAQVEAIDAAITRALEP